MRPQSARRDERGEYIHLDIQTPRFYERSYDRNEQIQRLLPSQSRFERGCRVNTTTSSITDTNST